MVPVDSAAFSSRGVPDSVVHVNVTDAKTHLRRFRLQRFRRLGEPVGDLRVHVGRLRGPLCFRFFFHGFDGAVVDSFALCGFAGNARAFALLVSRERDGGGGGGGLLRTRRGERARDTWAWGLL